MHAHDCVLLARGPARFAPALALSCLLGCSHLDELDRYNPALTSGAGACKVSIDEPTADSVFLATDDVDHSAAGVQVAGKLALSGKDCKAVRWGTCGQPLEDSRQVLGMSDKDVSVTFELSTGKLKLCAEADDTHDRTVAAEQVAVELVVCSGSQQLCGSEPICYDLDSDPMHCGDCSKRCPTQTHGAPACTKGTCTIACEDGYHLDPLKSGTGGECVSRPGCAGLATVCSGQDCCAWDRVAQDDGSGVRFQRGYDASNNGTDLPDEWQPKNDAARVTVQPFYLDRFEVSVARFRRFLADYDGWTGGGVQPRRDFAQHPALPKSGWQEAWNKLSLSDAVLKQEVPVVPTSEDDFRSRVLAKACGYHSFSDDEGDNEALPMNCVTFFEAFLFCMWDQARLPTEAEWNAAAASGEQRAYPWSVPPSATGIDADHALYRKSEQLPDAVGSHPLGAGPFGTHDLAGNVYEWTRDSEVADPACKIPNGSCSYGGDSSDPIELTADADPFGQQYHVLRGGSYKTEPYRLRTAHRYVIYSMTRISDIGFRCARPMVTN
jgi:formylglycine-generating enzyme required for sulfatase activity